MKNKYLLLILILALFFRFSVAFLGYHGDLNNNISWGTVAYEKGLRDFYGSSDSRDWEYSAPNQPPLTILMFAALRGIWEETESVINYLNIKIPIFPSKLVWFWDDKGMIFLVKLPSIVADLVIGLLIYRYILLKTQNSKKAVLALIIWLFNPLVWYNSSVWGQTDSIVNLFGFLAILHLLNKKIVGFFVLFTLSILFKGSLIIFTPLCVYLLIKQNHSIKKWMVSIASALIVILLSSFWFHSRMDFPYWIVNLYQKRIMSGEIDYLTANAFNFWYVINPGKVYDSKIIFGISARVIGFMVFGIVYGLILKYKKNALNEKRIIYSLSVIAICAFMFLTRMHERYLYPFFLYTTVLLPFYPRMIIPYVIFSTIHLFNLYNLFWVPPLPLLENVMKITLFPKILSIVSILIFFYVLIVYFRYTSSTKSVKHTGGSI